MASESANWVNLSEYGRQRGCTSQTVKVAIESGKLRQSVRQKANGKWEVLPDAANIEWALTRKNTTMTDILPPNAPSIEAVKSAARNQSTVNNVNPDKISLFEAQRRHENAKAEKAELQLAEYKGTLVNADDIKTEAFKMARMVRDGMLNIPDRVAAEFAGMTAAFDIHKRLTDEIHKALESLATI
jgi:hypothetical protein